MTTRYQSFCRKCHSSSSIRHANNTQKQATSYWCQRQSRLIQNSCETAQRTLGPMQSIQTGQESITPSKWHLWFPTHQTDYTMDACHVWLPHQNHLDQIASKQAILLVTLCSQPEMSTNTTRKWSKPLRVISIKHTKTFVPPNPNYFKSQISQHCKAKKSRCLQKSIQCQKNCVHQPKQANSPSNPYLATNISWLWLTFTAVVYSLNH